MGISLLQKLGADWLLLELYPQEGKSSRHAVFYLEDEVHLHVFVRIVDGASHSFILDEHSSEGDALVGQSDMQVLVLWILEWLYRDCDVLYHIVFDGALSKLNSTFLEMDLSLDVIKFGFRKTGISINLILNRSILISSFIVQLFFRLTSFVQ